MYKIIIKEIQKIIWRIFPKRVNCYFYYMQLVPLNHKPVLEIWEKILKEAVFSMMAVLFNWKDVKC